MEFGPKRGSILYIFSNFIKDFGLLIVALVIGLWQGNILGVLTDNIAVLAIVIVAPVSRLLDYLFTTYQVVDDKLIIRKGFLNKKVTEVHVSTITTIDLSQNLICQVLNQYKLKVDNVSNMAADNNQSKVNMIFGKENALLLKEILESKKAAVNGSNLVSESVFSDATGKEEQVVGTKVFVSADKILLMGLLETKGLLLLEGFGAIMVLSSFLEGKFWDQVANKVMVMSALVVVALILLLCGLFMVIGAVMSIIRFAGFTVTNSEKAIGIKYGLLNKKTFTLDKERISGFSYKQSWLMRKLKVGTLEVFAIGFGLDSEDAKERAVLHPLLPEADLRTFIATFITDFDKECEMRGTEKRALRYFFYRVSIILGIIAFACSVIASVLWIKWLWVFGTLVLMSSGLNAILEFYNTRAGGNEYNMELITGGINTQRTYIKTNNVESITDTATLFKRKKGYSSMHIDFLGPVATTSVEVHNIPISCVENLKKLLIY